jgi:phage tail-like protein
MPKVQGFWEGYIADRFVVTVNGTECPGVTKVTGLNLGEFDTIEQPQGGTSHIYKISSNKVKFQPLVIERRVDGSEEDKFFMSWFKETFDLRADRASGSAVRRSGLITKWHDNEEVLSFAFLHAWVKSATFTDLEAGTNNLLIMTVNLEHEGLELVNPQL